MIRNEREHPNGLTSQALRTWGMLALAVGIAGRAIIQNGMLGVGGMSGEQLLQAMQNTSYMGAVTIALILSAVEACAVPIFAFLLVLGFLKTANLKKYFLRVFCVALISEIPFDLVDSGKWFSFELQNPVFALVIALILLYFYRRYPQKKAQYILLKLAVTAAAVIWMQMLKVSHGAFFVILVAVLWLLRDKKLLRTFGGCAAAALCTLVSPFYLAAPVAFLAIHFYNGEQGANNRAVNYLIYPVLLCVLAAVSILM